MIIGKGGETIKRLGAESGAKIQFKQDGRKLIMLCCFYIFIGYSGMPLSYKSQLFIEILAEALSYQFSTRLINETRIVFIKVEKMPFQYLEDVNAPDRTATIQGTSDEIQRATVMISEIVNKVMVSKAKHRNSS